VRVLFRRSPVMDVDRSGTVGGHVSAGPAPRICTGCSRPSELLPECQFSVRGREIALLTTALQPGLSCRAAGSATGGLPVPPWLPAGAEGLVEDELGHLASECQAGVDVDAGVLAGEDAAHACFVSGGLKAVEAPGHPR
jgi:hypothetical protein